MLREVTLLKGMAEIDIRILPTEYTMERLRMVLYMECRNTPTIMNLCFMKQ